MSRGPARKGSTAQRTLRLPAPAEAPLLRPRGAGAVMAGRQAADDDAALLGKLDYFPTPPWAARAGGELITRLDPGAAEGDCWEPACGGGHMAYGLADYFHRVLISDIHDHGAPAEAGGPLLPAWNLVDFLAGGEALHPGVGWIVTNPPFIAGEAFIDRALGFATRGVAMLLRLQFRESGGRQRLFGGHPDWVGMATFADRVPMQKGSWNPDLSTATAYAWFIWMKPDAVAQSPMRAAITAAGAAGCGLDMAIPAGSKARLSTAADRVIFAGADAQGDLLDGTADASAARIGKIGGGA